MMEWDEGKRQKTLIERGLDFADIALVDWDDAITLEDIRHQYGETRYITFAQIHNGLCVIAGCYRGENIRVISLRKANDREIVRYGR